MLRTLLTLLSPRLGFPQGPAWGLGTKRAEGWHWGGGHSGNSQSQKPLRAAIPPCSLGHLGVPGPCSTKGILAGRDSEDPPTLGRQGGTRAGAPSAAVEQRGGS